jgi:hypothetical protein
MDQEADHRAWVIGPGPTGEAWSNDLKDAGSLHLGRVGSNPESTQGAEAGTSRRRVSEPPPFKII